MTVLQKVIGGGAWVYVKEGRFRDQQVAVKCVHELILSKQTMQRVYHEICTMSQVHHPNLVLFIAAVLDDQGGPMIITELLDTTLRKAYEDNLLKPGLDQEAFPVHPSQGVKPPPQTTKIDVYSYGILLWKVMREFPDPATLHEMKAKVKAKHASLHSLVLRCTETKSEKRPTMSMVLAHL